jgi:hypothetical protein
MTPNAAAATLRNGRDMNILMADLVKILFKNLMPRLKPAPSL